MPVNAGLIVLLSFFPFECAWAETLSLSLTNRLGQIVLSWPAWATDGILEQSTNFSFPRSWTAIPSGVYESDPTAFRYQFSSFDQSRIFRVRRAGASTQGLIGYWNLDEGSGQSIDSPVATSLYMTNVGWGTGRIGSGSLRFNGQLAEAGGSFACLSNANYQLLPPAGRPFSISIWFNPEALPIGRQALLGNGTDGWSLVMDNAGPATNYFIVSGGKSGSPINLIGRSLLLPGQWHQLTLTSATNQTSLYLDSELLEQVPRGLVNIEGPIYIGSSVSGYPCFLGLLDELRIYTNLLGKDQISITGQWHFDENAGRLTIDSSIQSHPAAVVSAGAWMPGKIGSAINLNPGPITIPNDQYCLLPPTGEAFSLSLWVCPGELPAGRRGLLNCAEGTHAGWQLTIDVDETSQQWIEFTSTNHGGTLALRTPCAFKKDSWSKLDLTYAGAIATVYVDGRKLVSEAGAIRATRAPLIAGAVPDLPGFNGGIDELTIYKRERNAAEIGPIALPLWEMALVNSSTDLLLPGSGPAGKPLTFAILSNPAPTLGTISWSAGSPQITYVAGGKKGPDQFVYTVSDGEFVSRPATGVVSVVEPHWLSPTGGTLPLLDGSSSDRAWPAGTPAALNAIWQTNSYYDCFFYSPGLFQTTGWKYRKRFTANQGCKHIGSGSKGPGATTVQLVNTWDAWEEGLIFGGNSPYTDGFEVHNMVLDCNANNNPKYMVGEPVWLRIPLTKTTHLDQVIIYWSDHPPSQTSHRIGRPSAFSLCTILPGTKGPVTNCVSLVSTGQIDVVTIAADTDEFLVQLNQRAQGVDYYGLAELEVLGAEVSLPTATVPGGRESLLDKKHSILKAFDEDPRSAWASGGESQVQITLPLARGCEVSQVSLRWNCQTLPDLRRLGPASTYMIYARDESTWQFHEVPFVSHGRQSNGLELATFGTDKSTNSVLTDQLILVLAVREQGVDSYSLRKISVQNAAGNVPLRIPSAMNTLGLNSILCAFDRDLTTEWASGTQGSVAGLDVSGSNLKFTGLKITGFGTKAGRECFPLAVLAVAPTARHPEPMSNVLVEDCVFTDPATNNTDGVTVVSVVGQGSGSLVNAVVRQCTVRGVRQFDYSHAFTASRVENCVVEDCGVGVYFEPDPNDWLDRVGPVVIRSNLFLNTGIGITVDFHPGARFDSLLCMDNEIVLGGNQQGYGIRFCDACATGPTGMITNVIAMNNIIRYSDWKSHEAALDGGLIYTDIRHAVYGNNLVMLGTPNSLRIRPYPAGLLPDEPTPEDCDNPRLVVPGSSSYPPSLDRLLPGYRRAWFNNRDLSGTLLPVRITESGVDRPAAQQQW